MHAPGTRPPRAPARSVWPHVALAAFVALAIVALVWPGYAWVSERFGGLRVLGLPFCMAWVAGWALASFAALGAYMLLTEREGDP
jgi:hypothetical protein